MNNLPQNLIDYVSSQIRAGAAIGTIRLQLTARNWRPEDVDQAIKMAQLELGQQPVAFSQSPMRQISQITAADSLLSWIFRAGFASIFLINGVIALLKPAEFEALVSTFPIAQAIGHTDLMIVFTGFNDLLLGLLILSGKAKKLVWAWAGAWLALVSLVKLVSLF